MVVIIALPNYKESFSDVEEMTTSLFDHCQG